MPTMNKSKPKPKAATKPIKQFKQYEIIVYATYLLGGASKSIHLEHIVARSFKLDPTMFSWELSKYKEWPNWETGRRAARTAKMHNLVVDSKNRWKLTQDGIDWVKKNRKPLNSLKRGSPQVDSEKEVFKLDQILTSALFLRYKQGAMKPDDRLLLTDMLSCTPDAENQELKFRMTDLINLSKKSELKTVTEFLNTCTRTFDLDDDTEI